MSAATRWALALIAALAIGLSWQLDGPEDHQADWSDSQALKELQASEAGSARRQLAAQRLCLEERGPNSEARWLEDGSLVCTTRRGLQALAVAQVQP
jgi:hypothetical protein